VGERDLEKKPLSVEAELPEDKLHMEIIHRRKLFVPLSDSQHRFFVSFFVG